MTTTLQDNAVVSAVQSEMISSTPLFALAPGERRAPITFLSDSKQNALVVCVNSGGLEKKNGAWHGTPGGKPVSGITIADLARDGLMTVATKNRNGSARLTDRGNWFARTLLCDGAVTK
jgi:hypothetical protein